MEFPRDVIVFCGKEYGTSSTTARINWRGSMYPYQTYQTIYRDRYLQLIANKLELANRLR